MFISFLKFLENEVQRKTAWPLLVSVNRASRTGTGGTIVCSGCSDGEENVWQSVGQEAVVGQRVQIPVVAD
jgi:hypothetical protein